jgi:hypothetical protein
MNHAIDRNTLVKVIDTILPATGRVPITEEWSVFYIRPGTINANDGGFAAASAKIDTDIEGLVPANDFVKLIKSSKGRFVEMNFSGDRLNYQFEDGMKGSLNCFQCTEYHESIDLWDSNIQWHSCPEELSEAIWLVSFNASRDLLGIFVSADYVVSIQRDHYRACRYKLSSPAPFDMELIATSPELFKNLRNKKLLKVAKLRLAFSPKDGDSELEGYAFDYGDLRIWCHVAKDFAFPDKKIICGKEFPKINRAFSKGRMENLFVLPQEIKKVIERAMVIAKLDKKAYLDYERSIIIRTEKDIITFQCDTEGGTFYEELSIKTFSPIVPMSLITIPAYFAQAAKQGGLMGIKVDENNTPFALYFKDEKLEHFIDTLAPDNNQEKEEK